MGATRIFAFAVALAAGLAVLGDAARAQDSWDPFRQQDERAREQSRSKRAGTDRQPFGNADQPERDASQPLGAAPEGVVRGELAPVMASDGSGLPHELWQGLDVPAIEEHLTHIQPPPRSQALNGLWKRVWASATSPPGGGQTPGHFLALKLEVLARSGLVADMREATGKLGQGSGPLVAAVEARALVGAGDREGGCTSVRSAVRQANDLPPPLRTDVLLISGYCAIADNNQPAAGIAAQLAREQQKEPSVALAVLEALAGGTKPELHLPQKASLLDYRFLELAGAVDAAHLVERAEPALLVVLAADQRVAPDVRIVAAEAAARLNALGTSALADAYRSLAAAPAEMADPASAPGHANRRRALMFKAVEGDRQPVSKGRAMRALLDDARRAGLLMPVAEMLEPLAADVPSTPDFAWFAQPAIEIALASGRTEQARRWIALAQSRGREGDLSYWLALADIADAGAQGGRDMNLQYVEQLALQGRLDAELMHRLVTVLDALDFQMPIPLWEAASRTPQPTSGHLPETGVLSQLQDASTKKEVARTTLLALRTLGANGVSGANMLALGDTIRALKRAGLANEAHRLGFEALFPTWPRQAGEGPR
jgi:hypothetical protein